MSTISQVEILLVEDNPRDAELTLRALRQRHLGNAIMHAKDGQEALDWLFATGPYLGRDISQTPKVILLDLKLPKVDGLEVLRALRANKQTRSIPVVILTSSKEHQDLTHCYAIGVNSYIVKPVDFENFSAAVAEIGHYWLIVNELPR